jgi:hypothetical protein
VLKEKYASGELKRKPRDPTSIRKGFKHTEETKAKIAETLRRKWAEDEEYRNFMTQRTIVNGDVRNSSSVRERIAETLRKRWEDPEFREGMMEKFKNRTKGQSSKKAKEHREKISLAMKQKWMDEEYRKRATKGMMKQRMNAPPKLVKPVPSKGAVVKKLDPIKKTIKKKKKKKKRKTVGDDTDAKKIDASPILAMEPLSATAEREIAKASVEVEEELPEGSIERLRKERKDLYDLLYGDDDEETHDNYIELPPVEEEDVSFTSMLLKSSNTVKSRVAPAKIERGPKPMFANGDSGASQLASLLADDEDLDDFDPYGLDNF